MTRETLVPCEQRGASADRGGWRNRETLHVAKVLYAAGIRELPRSVRSRIRCVNDAVAALVRARFVHWDQVEAYLADGRDLDAIVRGREAYAKLVELGRSEEFHSRGGRAGWEARKKGRKNPKRTDEDEEIKR